ncbi:hypothetical protein CYLTODRAFT_451904 [Cylindrobasidium torrendii FP15055 ss-10]|uniref:Uncharacterized protein n=1 Tax=Cylindrobasidium torrendii FP15055 ss-10 TaxID=1314674 RepID=A0A0D7BJF7_9AGAR|nr:hypothetical protein CYLTODRAFT_451904 [Cylindrobasidium torrendii FP15055 ss-10]
MDPQATVPLPWLPPRPSSYPHALQDQVPISPASARTRIVRIVNHAEVDAQPSPRSSQFLRKTRREAPSAEQSPQPRWNSSSFHPEILRIPDAFFRVYFHLYRLFMFLNIPLQGFLDFNVAYMIIQLSIHPTPTSSSASARSWALAAAAYIASTFLHIFLLFIFYEIIYKFVRLWRVKRPNMYPLYMSSVSFNYTAIQSYDHFCFMQTLRLSAFGFYNGLTLTEKGLRLEGDMKDGLAETAYFYSQNLPTVALLLPRAGISIAILLQLTSLSIDNQLAGRDATFFTSVGTLSEYSRVILYVNAIWVAWRAIVLIISWLALWILSEQGCAGICGPRFRWNENDHESVRRHSGLSDYSAYSTELPWDWRDCTKKRLQALFEFCLVTPKRRSTRLHVSIPHTQDTLPRPKPSPARPHANAVFSLNDSAEEVVETPKAGASNAQEDGASTEEEEALAASSSTETISISSMGLPLSTRGHSVTTTSAASATTYSPLSSLTPYSVRSSSSGPPVVPAGPNRARSGSVPLPGPSSPPNRPAGRPRARTRLDSMQPLAELSRPSIDSLSSGEAGEDTSLIKHVEPRRPRIQSSTRPFSAFMASRSNAGSPSHNRSHSSHSSVSMRSKLQSMRSRAQSLISSRSSSKQDLRAASRQDSLRLQDPTTDEHSHGMYGSTGEQAARWSLPDEEDNATDSSEAVDTTNHDYTFGQRPPWAVRSYREET